MRVKHLLLLTAFFFFTLPGIAQYTYYVTPNGDDAASGSSWTEAATLYGALSKTGKGDTIRIAEGDYYVSADTGSWTITNDLTIIGGYSTGEIAGAKPHGNASSTVLHGCKQADGAGANRRVLNIVGRPQLLIRVTIENLIITGGNGRDEVPYIVADLAGQDAQGGGILSCYAETVLRDVTITENTAADGGNYNARGGGIAGIESVLTLTGNTVIKNNTAASSSTNVNGYGGGVMNRGGSLIINENASIENNIASAGSGGGYGGGIFSEGDLAIIILSGGTITDNKAVSNPTNKASGEGGGIYNGNRIDTRAVTAIKGNIATNGLGEGRGGGIYNSRFADIDLSCGLIESNIAVNNPSNTVYSFGGGICNDGKVVLQTGIVIKDNIGTNGLGESSGGGIYNAATATLTLSGGLIESNIAINHPSSNARGVGGIYNDEGVLDWKDAVIIRNNRASSHGKETEDNIHPIHIAWTLDLSYIIPEQCVTTDRGAGSYAIKKNQKFEFVLTVAEEYINIEPDVTSYGTVINPVDKNNYGIYQYALSETAGIQLVQIELAGNVVLPELPQGISYNRYQSGTTYRVAAGYNFEFSLAVSDSLLYRNLIITADGGVLEPIGVKDSIYSYSLKVTTSHPAIQIRYASNTVNLHQPPAGMTLSHQPGIHFVLAGNTFEFVLTTDAEYKNKEVIVITDDGTVLLPFEKQEENGGTAYRYALTVSKSMDIQFRFDFTVVRILDLPNGFSAAPYKAGKEYPIPFNSVFNFTLTVINENYKSIQPGIMVDGVILNPDSVNDVTYHYSLRVKESTDFRVVLPTLHAVSFIPLQGVSVESSQPRVGDVHYVSPGSAFTFTLTVTDERYKYVEPIVTAGGNVLSPNRKSDSYSYQYSLTATSNITVQLQLDYREITFVSTVGDGIKIAFYGDNYTSNKIFCVKPDMTYRFSLQTAAAYRTMTLSLLVNGKPHTINKMADGNGLYEFSLGMVSEPVRVEILLHPDAAVFPENEVKIYTRNGSLVAESPAETLLTVYALTGQIKAQRTVTGTESIALPQGTYIVKAGTERRKVTVK
ncbi:hypothetical protein Barb6_01143 [Bacteroidales bacterium Barb6]|nr:hypothetical protein Barb6_01143 [Bacteroidales bacterium Barb6]